MRSINARSCALRRSDLPDRVDSATTMKLENAMSRIDCATAAAVAVDRAKLATWSSCEPPDLAEPVADCSSWSAMIRELHSWLTPV